MQRFLKIYSIMALKDNIQTLLGQVNELKANNAEELEALRIKYLSKKGEITALFNEFRNVAPEEKRELGQLLNQLRQQTEGRINELKEQFEAKKAEMDKQDLTRTPDPIALGTRHPLSLVREEIEDIFSRIGFTIAQGPEVEDSSQCSMVNGQRSMIRNSTCSDGMSIMTVISLRATRRCLTIPTCIAWLSV